MTEVNTTTRQRDALISMFLDGTEDEVYHEGRLYTVSKNENVTALVAYGWNKIAEYNSATDTVTVFDGHRGNISPTVTEYVDTVREMAGLRQSRQVNVLSDAAPNLGVRPPADAAQYIEQYVSFAGSDSPVEQKARRDVSNALARIIGRTQPHLLK